MSRRLRLAVLLSALAACGEAPQRCPACEAGLPADATRPLESRPGGDRGETAPPARPLAGVAFWAYQIVGLDRAGAVDQLAASRYDLLVVDPTRTDKSLTSFDGKGMVSRLHATQGKSGRARLVLAYVDLGEAEQWRTYWQSSWVKPTASQRGDPDFLITTDPDGWSGNYPVAYWDPRWRSIIIDGPGSVLQQVLDDGYDGIYLDWIEAYQNVKVAAAAKAAGKDAAAEMVAFVAALRAQARARRPDFLVVPQNAPELAAQRPEYVALLDGFVQEQIYFDGKADLAWTDPAACDLRRSDSAATEAKLRVLQSAGVPVLNVEYACAPANVAEAYSRSTKNGTVAYVTRRPLDRLSSTPPPGY